MNLKHTFGHNGDTGVTCGDDGVTDTPTTWGKSEIDTTTSTTLYACGNWTNVENVMDYTRTQTMFTTGQLAKVDQTLTSSTWSRNNLWTQANLIATGLATSETVLSSGVAQSVTLATGTSKLFSITLPAGKASLTVNLSGGTGDCDLYTKFGSAPTTTVYDARSWGSTNVETITINSPAAGKTYILVDAYAACSSASVKATAQ